MSSIHITAIPAFLAAVAFGIAPTPAPAQAGPDGRAHHALVHHGGDSLVYLIGGSTRRGAEYHYFDDMWAWNGATWTALPALPFPRSSHRVVYHRARTSLILFGGGFAHAVRADGVLWEWSGGAWKAVGGHWRAGAAEPEMCYDGRRERLVLFGGWDAGSAFRGDTWEWAGDELVRADTAGPAPRAGHMFLFDPVRQRCLLFGGQGADGYFADTWTWDGATWTRLDVAGPAARWFVGAAAHPEQRLVVIFGGRGPDAPVRGRDASGNFADTWIWDGARWVRWSAEGPDARMGARMAFTGRHIVLFGGRAETADGWEDRDDTWELRDRAWVRVR